MIAQKLYEGIEVTGHSLQGLITYMRTDSVRTEPESLNAVREYIGSKYGKKYLSESPIEYKKKKNNSKIQDAHEAIRPTNLEFSPENIKGDLDADQMKLYELIWNKFISSQMAQAVIDQTTVTSECGGHFFKSTGSIIKFAGFRTVYLELKPKRKKIKVKKKLAVKILSFLISKRVKTSRLKNHLISSSTGQVLLQDLTKLH